MRRAVWIVVAALVALVGSGVGLAFALRPSSPPRPYVAAAHAAKLRISIPRGFYRYTFHDGIGDAETQFPPSGQVLSDAPVGEPTLDDWLIHGPPANQVGLLLSVDWTYYYLAHPDNLYWPLTLEQPWFEQHGVRVGTFSFGIINYRVVYWSGPQAPAKDRAAVLRALHSIRPAH